MIFDIKVNIEWIGEDSSVDQQVKDQVVNRIVEQIKASVVDKNTEAAIKARINEFVDEWILSKLKEFCNKKINITDKWGDTIEHHESVNDMFKAKFDEFFDASVDQNGKTLDSCSFKDKRTRIDYLLDKMAKDYLKKITNDIDGKISRAIDKEMKLAMEEKIKKHALEKISAVVS